MRIALSTGGGDAPGLNAVIRAAVLSAVNRVSMIALQSPHIVTVPLAEVLKTPKRVEIDHDTVLTARATGISFGD